MTGERRIIHLASGNRHKVGEMQRLADASGLPIQIAAALAMPPVVEDTGTFTGNARKKACALRSVLPDDAWVLADDSGLCVDALDGRPGVESAYYAGPAGDEAANLAKLVHDMRGIPPERRGARFACILLLLPAGETERVFEGLCPGTLRDEPVGVGGFGYDPIFVPLGLEKTYAEIPAEMKNRISHRALAFASLARWLRDRE